MCVCVCVCECVCKCVRCDVCEGSLYDEEVCSQMMTGKVFIVEQQQEMCAVK